MNVHLGSGQLRRPNRTLCLTLAPHQQGRIPMTDSASATASAPEERDSADLAQFGYNQELKRSLEGLGWHAMAAGTLNQQLVTAAITLVVITILNIYGVRLVAIINNTGVVFEILGMFVFAIILMAFHNHQGFGVVTNSAGIPVN